MESTRLWCIGVDLKKCCVERGIQLHVLQSCAEDVDYKSPNDFVIRTRLDAKEPAARK